MPITVGNSTVNTSVANSTVTVDQTQSWFYTTSNRNSIRPSLLLAFARSQTVDPRVVLTRASSATYINSIGNLVTAGNNVARIDYNFSTGVSNGLLIEQSSTNLIRNNTMVGAVVTANVAAQTINSITFSGTTATVTTAVAHGLAAYGQIVTVTGAAPTDYNLTQQVSGTPTTTSFTYTMATTPATNATVVGSYTAVTVGSTPTQWATFASNIPYTIVNKGTINGLSFIDYRFFGLTIAALGLYSVIAMDYVSTIAVSAGVSHTVGFYCALVAGSTTGVTVVAIDNRYDVGGTKDLNILSQLTSTLQRFNYTTTPPTGATTLTPAFALNYTGNTQVDITLRFAMPQCEILPFATSVISTAGAAATRAADDAVISGPNFSSVYNPYQGTVLFQGAMYATTTDATSRVLWGTSDGTSNNAQYVSRVSNAGTLNMQETVSNVTSSLTTNNSINANVVFLTSSYYSQPTTYGIVLNGSNLTSTSSGNVQTATQTQLVLGNAPYSGATNYINGWINRIAYYPTALSNSELITLTS